ncbi:MAG: 4-hydroxy-tetrahydrodipicolinate reductase [Longimicrobiaceae bacterium]
MAKPVKLFLSGATGRMGRAVARLANEDPDFEVAGGIGHGSAPGFPLFPDAEAAGELLSAADAVIDFSSPELLAGLLDRHSRTLAGKALAVGTTGLGEELEDRLRAQAESSAVLASANFSPGVSVLLALVRHASGGLGDGYRVEIVEAHHRGKTDAPSGTALLLGRAVSEGGGRQREETGFHSLRGGGVIGEHRVFFLGERERLELAHVASDRDLFAEGALRAAKWLAAKPAGWYRMEEVLGVS